VTAKMSRGLTVKIFKHALSEGWIWPNRNVVVTKEILEEIKKELDNNQCQRIE